MLFLPFLFTSLPLEAVTQQYSCEYTTSTTKGEITSKRVVNGSVETHGHTQVWRGVTMTPEAGAPMPQAFMEGFSVDLSVEGVLSKPDIFKSFPSTAVEGKDIVSDLVHFNKYITAVRKAKPGSALTIPSPTGDSKGELTLSVLGSTDLDGHHCRIIQFDSFFNKVEFSVPEVRFQGRSHCWGDIWVDQHSNLIVHATLKEDLLGELTMGDSKTPMIMNILRKGILELK